MIHDRAQISLSLSFFLCVPSSIRLLLFYLSTVPTIVIKSARRTGRGLLQLPSNPYCPSVHLPPMDSGSFSLPSLSSSLISPLYAPLYLPYALTPFSPPLSVCHELHVKTYLVSFAQWREEVRGEARGKGRNVEKEEA